MRYYWNNTLISQLVRNNLAQNQIHYWNKEYETGMGNLICLNNQYDLKYNYTDRILDVRYEKLKNMIIEQLSKYLKFCDLNTGFMGEDCVKALGLGIYPEQVTLFFADRIEFIKETTVKYKHPYYYLQTDDCIFKIYQYANDINQLLLLGISNVLIDSSKKIYSNAKFYQDLSTTEINLECIEEYPLVKLYNLRFYSNAKMSDSNIARCYICKKCYDSDIYIESYNNLCISCSQENYTNKNLKADLSSMSFLVTGGRVKLGFSSALKLLRMGASVVTTTRYPHFAMRNYQSEPDYVNWKDKLVIVQCDFTKLEEIYSMLKLLDAHNFNGIINNACQTIRASSLYYSTVQGIEAGIESSMIENNDTVLETQLVSYNKISSPQVLNNTVYGTELAEFALDTKTNVFKDVQDIPHLNSWDKKIDEISPEEIVECTLINQLVPTLLINKLKPRLQSPKFIINVTSLEGSFHNNKNDKHPHTNMCKASMNMLIRTLGEDSDKDLHVYAINPGYVSGVCPQLSKYAIGLDDGASRIIYPIVRLGLGHALTKDYAMMQNYKPASW
jgi:NAD(P)-dependent dehydrogenase (short-subunit alcohol dehydrogenase family)